MTNNMERMKLEVVRAIVTCFPKDYIEMAFAGGVSEREFVDEIIVEFIKYAFIYIFFSMSRFVIVWLLAWK